jgi:hypothetical protein
MKADGKRVDGDQLVRWRGGRTSRFRRIGRDSLSCIAELRALTDAGLRIYNGQRPGGLSGLAEDA